jgi:hypothetical protein
MKEYGTYDSSSEIYEHICLRFVLSDVIVNKKHTFFSTVSQYVCARTQSLLTAGCQKSKHEEIDRNELCSYHSGHVVTDC